MLLITIIFILIATILIILVGNFFKIQQGTVRSISLIATLLCFFLSIFFFLLFDRSTANYQFILSNIFSNYDSNYLSMYKPHWVGLANNYDFGYFFLVSFGLDGISLFFVLLTTFITPLCLLTAYKQGLTRVKDYCLVLLTLELFLVLSFTALDLFAFFIFFESILIPMFFFIGI
jgi:NADH-quinone oxidoreductase subunit M